MTDIYLLICDSCAHMTMTIKTKSHAKNGICEYNCAKALIIIISSLHSFLRFHKGVHVLIESRMIQIPGMSIAHVPEVTCYHKFTFKFVLFVRISI